MGFVEAQRLQDRASNVLLGQVKIFRRSGRSSHSRQSSQVDRYRRATFLRVSLF